MLSKKSYIMLFISVILFTCVVFYFGFKYEKKYFTLIVDPDLKIKYDGKNWNVVKENLAKLEKDCEVYDSNGYLGVYNLSYLKRYNRWLVYNDDMTEVEKEGDIVAFKSKFNTKYFGIQKREINVNDKKILDKILKNNKIDITLENAHSSKYEIDLNGDYRKDEILVSTLYSSDNNNSDAFTMAVAVINNKEYEIYFRAKKEDTSFSVPTIKLDAILDVQNDGHKELVFTVSSYGDSNVCVLVNEITKNGVKKIVHC